MLTYARNNKIYTVILFFFSLSLFAQPKGGTPNPNLKIGRLYGKVVDENKKPLAYATVTVMKQAGDGTETMIEGALTIENGDFNITSLPMGAFKVTVSYLGYKDINKPVKIAPNNAEQDMGDLIMMVDAQMLNAVEIKADKVSAMISLEKRVFNVDKNITAAGGTAEDILKNVPSVSVDSDGNAKLRDKGTTVYVDGKPSLMVLNQIPSDQIESVEVISNPSAKYEAATTGGIINIVLKKNRKPGYNGVVSLGTGTQDRYNGSFNLNVNEGKWAYSGFYSFNTANVLTNAYLYRTNRSTDGVVSDYFNQNSDNAFKNTFHTGRLNIDYNVNNRNKLSLSGSINNGIFVVPVTQTYASLSALNLVNETGNRTTDARNEFLRNNIEAQWKKAYAKKDKSLTVMGNYAWGNVTNQGNWNTSAYDSEGNLLQNFPLVNDITGGNNNSQGLFQIDYVNPINDSTRFEMGIRSFFSAREQQYFFKTKNNLTNEYILDGELSLDARITESINAAYFTYSGTWKHRISYQAGLRFEQSDMTGISRLEGGSDFGYSYPKGNSTDILRSLFPSLFITKKLNDATELGVNFSRKIQRPNFRQLMPGIQSNDRQNITVGNPTLQPEFINLAELNYNKIFGANNWLSTIYFSNETNTIKPFIRPSENDPTVLITTFVNGTNEIKYGFDNTLKLAIGKKLDFMLNANVFNFNVTVDTFTNTGWAANAKANINYKLPANFALQINNAYEGNRPIPQGNRQGIFFTDIALKKSFFNNAASLTLAVNDVFNTRKDITFYDQPTFVQESMRRRESRFFRVTLQIPFGKADASLFKKSNRRQDSQDMPDFGS